MRFSKVKVAITLSFLFFALMSMSAQKADAYYGMGLGSLYGGLYGGGYGLYGGLYGGYGMYGGLYGMGMYGGLYGMGMYGGLYGMGMYGGLYGGYGMYGGLYGMGLYGGLYGMGLYGGLYGSSLYGYGGLRYGLAEQAGTWEGLWSSGLVSGPMTLNIVVDPVLGGLAGYVQLLGNPTLGSLVDVTGTSLNNQIILSGSGIGLGGMTFTIDITGTLTSTTAMTGTYTLINSSSLVETGSFQLGLLTPVI
ncbi:MAG: hypothetical protein AB1847_17735 [bacterium]